MRIADRIVVCAAVLALGGCSSSMYWQTVKDPSWPTGFIWHGEKELWATGGDSALRRLDGKWESLDLCPAASIPNATRSVDVAFEGDAVWAMCGDSARGTQLLIKHDGKGTGTTLELPFDGLLKIVPLLTGAPALLGDRGLWLWDGTQFTIKSEHPLVGKRNASFISAVGLSSEEIYAVLSNGGDATIPAMSWWNGSRWQAVLGGGGHKLELRFGKVWMGLSSIEAGEVTPADFKGIKALTDKHLVLRSWLDKDHALATNGQTIYYSIGANDLEPVLMGRSTVGETMQAGDVVVYDVYGNSGTILSRGDNGTGISDLYGIDLNTMLVVYTIGGGIGGGASAHSSLIEGHR